MSHPVTSETSSSITGGHLLAKCLKKHQVERVFGVPGESFLSLLDGLLDAAIPYVTCRQEGGASMMAEAEGKLTGRPGICTASRAPGATNASAGVHIAFQDSTPMILLIGQVELSAEDREAFQEVDLVAMFAPLAKWSAQISDPRRIPEYLNRAFQVAMSGRPGPVVLVLPEDMLMAPVNQMLLDSVETLVTPHRSYQGVAPKALVSFSEQLKASKKPLFILGGGGWSNEACQALEQFLDHHPIPTFVEFRRQDLLRNTHQCYAGHLNAATLPAQRKIIEEADLICLIGGRLGEMPSKQYALLAERIGSNTGPLNTFIHIHQDPNEIGRVYRTDLGIVASMTEFTEALCTLIGSDPQKPTDYLESVKKTYEQTLTLKTNPGKLQWGEIVSWLNDHLDKQTIVCNGAGNSSIWLHRYYQWHHFKTQLAPSSGSMGYGLPSAISAACHLKASGKPHQPVLAVVGDGDFMMTFQELGTIAQEELAILILVVNNSIYGTIKMHQEREYPNRPIATKLSNPNFSQLAESFGFWSSRVETTQEFYDIFPLVQEQLKANKTVLLDIILDEKALTPDTPAT